MSGQRSHKTSAEQGWLAMKDILDREMPIAESKRRRNFWFWLTSAVAPVTILLVAGGLYVNNKVPASDTIQATSILSGESQSQSIPVVEQTGNETSTSSQITPIQNSTVDQEKATQSSLNTISQITPSSATPNSQIKNSNSNINSGNSSTSDSLRKGKVKSSNNNQSPKKTQAQSPISEPIASLENSAQESFHVYVENEVIGSIDQSLSSAGNYQDAAPDNSSVELDIKQIDALSMSGIHYTPGHEELIISPNPSVEATKVNDVSNNKFFASPYIFGSGVVGVGQGLGYQAGLGIALSVTPWLRGVVQGGYQSVHPQTTVFRDLKDYIGTSNDILEEAYYDGQIGNIINGSNLNSNTPVDNLYPYLNKVEQWQAKAGLQADLGKWFSVEGGYGFGFNTKIRTEIPILHDVAALPISAERSYELNSYHIVRENMHSIYAGVGFRPAKCIEFFGRYEHVFKNYLNLDASTRVSERRDNLSGIQLGVRIYPL